MDFVNLFFTTDVQSFIMEIAMDIDLKLKNRIKLGDKSAFEDIVGNFKKKIFYFCFDLTGSVLDAEDLSQDVFIKVFKSYSQFRGEASISSWLYRITLNTFLDQKRKISFLQEKKQLSIDENRFNDSLAAKNHPKTGPENFAESRQIQIHLQMALKRLTKKER